MSEPQKVQTPLNSSIPVSGQPPATIPNPQLMQQQLQQQMMAAMPDTAFICNLMQQAMSAMSAPSIQFSQQDGQYFKDECSIRFEIEE